MTYSDKPEDKIEITTNFEREIFKFNSQKHWDIISDFLYPFMNKIITVPDDDGKTLNIPLGQFFEVLKNKSLASNDSYTSAIPNDIFKLKSIISTEICNDVDLICMCASHINSLERFDKLKNMLTSFKNQIYKINMLLSISFDEKLQYLKDSDEFKHELLVVKFRKEKKSQFEHYKLLTDEYISMYENHWILFTDDDDLWANTRTIPYNVFLQSIKLNKKPSNSQYFCYPFLLESKTYYSDIKKITHEEISNMFSKINNNMCMHMFNLEYINFSTTLSNLKKFTDNSSSKLLKHSLCDRYFIFFLTEKIPGCILQVSFWNCGYFYNNTKYLENKFSISAHDILTEDLEKINKSIEWNLIETLAFRDNFKFSILKKQMKELLKLPKIYDQFYEKKMKEILVDFINGKYDDFINSPLLMKM